MSKKFLVMTPTGRRSWPPREWAELYGGTTTRRFTFSKPNMEELTAIDFSSLEERVVSGYFDSLMYLFTNFYQQPGVSNMAMTIPELKLDNGFTIPNVTINDPAAFLKAIKTAKPTSSICPQLRNTLRGGDADNLGDALLARYGSNRLGHSMSRVTGIFPSLEYVRDARASWIKHVIETLIEKNNLLLCRRPAFSNALRGTQLYFGSSADAMSEVEYLCNAPKHQGYHIVLHEGEPATVRGEDLHMIPLCWVEGRPVYPGETGLYYANQAYEHNGKLVVEGMGLCPIFNNTVIKFKNGTNFKPSSATWKRPVVGTDREGKTIHFGDPLYYVGKDANVGNVEVKVLHRRHNGMAVEGRIGCVNEKDLTRIRPMFIENGVLQVGDVVYSSAWLNNHFYSGKPLTVLEWVSTGQVTLEYKHKGVRKEALIHISNLHLHPQLKVSSIDGIGVEVGEDVFFKPSGEKVTVVSISESGDDVVTIRLSNALDTAVSASSLTRVEPAKFIEINGFKVPEPLRVEPKIGTFVYYVGTYDDADCTSALKWRGCDGDKRLLQRGLIHATQEAARLHSEALLSFTKPK